MPFNIGPGELIIVLIIALIVVGPGRLPDVGASLGKSIREFRKAAADVKESTSMDAPAAPTAPAATPTPPPAQAAAPAVSTAPPVPAMPPASASAQVAAPVGPAAGVQVLAAEEAEEAAEDQAAASGSEWPAEVTPVDEQQPTPSA
jgi:TatA/E family protein of Tat protein translocase